MPSDNNVKTHPPKSKTQRDRSQRPWPVPMERTELRWYPASTRLIGLVRANVDKFVLPPAVVRKASWRD